MINTQSSDVFRYPFNSYEFFYFIFISYAFDAQCAQGGGGERAHQRHRKFEKILKTKKNFKTEITLLLKSESSSLLLAAGNLHKGGDGSGSCFFAIDKAPLSDLAEHYVKQIQSAKTF